MYCRCTCLNAIRKSRQISVQDMKSQRIIIHQCPSEEFIIHDQLTSINYTQGPAQEIVLPGSMKENAPSRSPAASYQHLTANISTRYVEVAAPTAPQPPSAARLFCFCAVGGKFVWLQSVLREWLLLQYAAAWVPAEPIVGSALTTPSIQWVPHCGVTVE